MHLINNFNQYRKVQNEKSPLLKGNHHQQFLVYSLGRLFWAYCRLYMYSIENDLYIQKDPAMYAVR